MQHILSAGYDSEAMPIEGPFTPVFERLSLAMSVRSRTLIEGHWGEVSDPNRNQVSLQVDALDVSAAVRVDALWQGSIVAGASSARSRIESLTATWPGTSGIDAEIILALGSLPAAENELEAERRQRLLARWRAAALQPDALSDAFFDEWLASIGAVSVSELMVRLPGLVAAGPMQLGFSAPTETPAARRPLPISAAILVRDQPLDLSGLLADSRVVRDTLDALGAMRPPDAAGASRARLIVVWIIPGSVFDDPDWPGGNAAESAENNNALRLATARRWLAREAIALLALPAHPA